MTDTNRELIQKWADLWSGPSKADFLGIFSTSCLYEDVAAGKIMRGKTELGDFFKLIKVALPDFTVITDLICLCEHGGTIQWHMKGTHEGELFGHKATHKKILVHGACVIRIKRNKLIKCTDYYDMKTLYRQLGFDKN
ncbi:ester cyclase [Pseudomonas reactans]|uniref:ester cyclase n=1 Tax=Pseudomonas reactans TaxID=117680 RepID=UPI0015A450F3|nr:ester cyclase [Pseudomonas reactans]NWF13134.1 ester cyclase [Pseudomonas reactans]